MDKLHQLQSALCADPARLRVLRLVRDLCLPDCWVGAGFVRSAIWDMQHGRPFSPLPSDIDVIWFDETLLDPAVDNLIEANLCRLAPSLNWSVKNQARMHVRNDDPPYSCATSAMKAWPETARHSSTESVLREFYARCSSTLFWSRSHDEFTDWVSIALSSLDSPFTSLQQKHLPIDSRVHCYTPSNSSPEVE
jgi:hypothetical protein